MPGSGSINVRFTPESEHFNNINGFATRLTPFCS